VRIQVPEAAEMKLRYPLTSPASHRFPMPTQHVGQNGSRSVVALFRMSETYMGAGWDWTDWPGGEKTTGASGARRRAAVLVRFAPGGPLACPLSLVPRSRQVPGAS